MLASRDDALQHRICPRCQVRLCDEHVDDETCRWLLVWHQLTHCDEHSSALPNLEGFALDHVAWMLRAADERPLQRASLHQHSQMILQVLRLARAAVLPNHQHLPLIQDFLAFLMCPGVCFRTSVDLARRLYTEVGQFLRGHYAVAHSPDLASDLICAASSDDSGSDADVSSAPGSDCAPGSPSEPQVARGRCIALRPLTHLSRLQCISSPISPAWGGRKLLPPVPPPGREAEAPRGMA
jgi:hypothetical protein